MEVGLIIAIGLAVAFALTNGFHDASNAIATLVATRGATPGQAVALSAVFNMAGAILLGTAVADTIGGIVTVPDSQMVAVVGAGLAGAVTWNLLTWWRGLPSSSAYSLRSSSHPRWDSWGRSSCCACCAGRHRRAATGHGRDE